MRVNLWGLMGLALFALVACGGNKSQIGDLLSLAPGQPTFVFFFTDN